MERYLDENLMVACDMCGQIAEHCICPQCPMCDAHGDPACYLPYPYGHSLPYAPYQLKSLTFTNAEYHLARDKEDRFWDDEFILSQFNGNPADSRWPWQCISYTNEEHRDCLLRIACAMNDNDFPATTSLYGGSYNAAV